MSLPQPPLQWSPQLGPSLTNSYDQRRKFDRENQNPEGMFIVQFIPNLVIFDFQENLVLEVPSQPILVMEMMFVHPGIDF
jgi:hypothetical protein